MFRKLFMGVAMAAVAVSASAQAETVSIHGSTTVFANVFKANKAKIEKAAGVTLKVVSNGSGRGLADLSAGKADMGMISSDLAATVAKANKKRPGSVNPAGLTAHKLGETRVAFIVHPSNGVKTLTMDQVKAILSGQAKNWKDVGGNDKPIVIISEPTGGGIRSMVEKEVLSKASVKGTLRQVPNGTQVPLVVSQLPNAFGIASIAATKGVKVAEVATGAKIAQPLFLVTKGAPSASQQKVIEASKATLVD